MFCPKCSQQQISDNIRFCSRCGFQLSVVKALLSANDASLSNTSESYALNRLRRKKDMIIGALLMLPLALHTAWTTEDLSLEREYTSLIVKCFILCVLINIMPVIRDFLRAGNPIQESSSAPKMLSGLIAKLKNRNRIAALPDAYSRPTDDYITGRITTSGLVVPPPSVTEDTTNLLRNN